jgi:hypothetical protein
MKGMKYTITPGRREDYICVDCGIELGVGNCPTCAAEPDWEFYLAHDELWTRI